MTRLVAAMVVSAGLALTVAHATEEDYEEESLSVADIPAAVIQTAENEAKGGKIARWAKEGANYEVVITKKGKEWSVIIDPNGKVLGKQDESEEEGE